MSQSKPIHILYMEDDEGLANLVKNRLVGEGYEVDIARDGEEGLLMYEAGSYDLIALDYEMPVYNGLEVIEKLLQMGDLPPTIMITGAGGEELVVEAMKLGVGDYVVKDIEGRYLELIPAKIERIFKQHKLVLEKKRAEEALILSEKRYEMATSAGKTGVWDWNIQTDEIFVDPRLKEMLGYQDHEIKNNIADWGSFVHPDDKDLVMEKANAHFEGKTPQYECEHRMIKKDGEIIWLLARGTAIRDEKENIIRMLGTDTDITERVLAEEALKESNEKIFNIFSSISDGFLSLDNDLVVTYCNEAAEDLMGRKRENMLGRNLFEAFPKAKGSIFEENYIFAIKEKKPIAFQTYFGVKPYENWYDVRVYPFEDGISVYFQITTERKQAEKALKESEESLQEREAQLSAILSSSMVGIGYSDDRKIKWANEAMTKMFGFEDERDFVGKDTRMLYPTDEEYERVGKAIYEGLKAGKNAATDTKFIRKDGSVFDGHIKVSVPDPSKPMNGTIANIMDITERKRAGEALRESEELYRQMFVDNGAIMLLINPESGEVVDANPSASEFYGYSLDELKSMKISDINILSVEEIAEEMEKAKNAERRFFEFRHRLSSGEIRDVDVYSSPINIKGQKILFSVINDSTYRKKAEEELKESEEKYRSFVQNFQGIAFRGNLDFAPIFFHGKVEEITGYTEEEFISGNPRWDKIVHPDDLHKISDSIENIHSVPNFSTEREYRIICKDRQIKWIYENIQNITDDSGKPFKVQGTITDITERKRAEEQLRKKTYYLGERVKELNCLYDIASIVAKQGISFDEKLQEIVKLIPPSWQYPEVTCVRLILRGREFATKNFEETKWKQECDIIVHGEKGGGLEICYLEEMPDEFEGPFMKEERDLISAISERLGKITELIIAEEALKESNEKIFNIFSSISDGFLSLDNDLVVTYCNEAAEDLMGRKREDVLGRNLFEAFPKAKGSIFEENYIFAIKEKKPIAFETYFGVKPYENWFDVRVYPFEDGISIYFQITTDQKRTEERIIHFNRVLRSIRDVNQLIVREKDKDTLLKESCKIINEVTGYRLVWIGFIEEGHKRVIPVANAGFNEGYLDNIEITWDNTKTGKGPTGTAIRTKKVCVFNDVVNNNKFLPWKKEAVKRGYRSSIAVPIIHGDKVFGVLNVCSEVVNAFVDEEIDLLVEISGDIAFALYTIELEKEREKTGEALIREKERAQKYLDIAEVILVALNDKGKITLINRKGNCILGYEEGELIGKNWFDTCLPEDDKDEVSAVFEKLMEGEIEPAEYFENAILTKTGEERIIAWHNSIYRNKEGNITGILSSGEDITEIKRAQEVIWESKKKLELVLQGANLGYWDLNLKTGILTHNERFMEIVGYSKDEIEDPPSWWEKNIHPDDKHLVLEALASRLKGETHHYNVEHRLLSKSGEYVWVNDIGKVVEYDEEGNPVRMAGITYDITEKKRAEEVLKESEEKFRNLFESSRDIVYLSSSEGKFVEINRSGEELFGYTRDELFEMDILKIYNDPNDRDKFQGTIDEKGFAKDYEMTLKKKDGTPVECLITATLRKDESGSIIGYQGTIRDVSERKRMEEQLLRAEKMESLGTLTGGIAHDFNNILATVLGYASFLKSKTKKGDSFYEGLDAIENSSLRAADLTAQLLAYTRRGKLEIKPVNLNRVVKEVYALISKTFDKSIKIELKTESNLKTVEGDESQLSQVIMNVAVNAQNAMPKGGTFQIETYMEKVEEKTEKGLFDFEPGNYVCMRFTDTGIGMDEETLKRIFEPYFTTMGDKGGTGLGMSVVFGIVKGHDGYINIESKLGEGTDIIAYLPASTKKEEILDKDIGKTLGGTETVLIIDDEEPILKITKILLEEAGYNVYIAGSGKTGLETFKTRDIDLVILDIKMPEMGGEEVLEKMLKIDSKVKVLLSSGYSEEDQHHGLLEMGAKGFIGKPFVVDKLLKKMREVLG